MMNGDLEPSEADLEDVLAKPLPMTREEEAEYERYKARLKAAWARHDALCQAYLEGRRN
jgi:hypothetical protein